eukprot:TRINITY_DN28029_c1_g2_i1.p4 TRINITY_DN28029_c1_g2~~TRINITY_DN28029_c1_g2_i1.p4  ORF type:complete len:125 (-),score=17.32 TRINITY_DN28029_c1_g2_i1:974-1348(-)
MASWNSDLCECTKDCSVCCYGFFCLPCLVGENAEKIRGRGGVTTGCCFFWGALIPGGYACVGRGVRRDLREKFGLPADPCNDCCTYCYCAHCAACQEARELSSRRVKHAPVLVQAVAPAVVGIV